MDYKFIFEMFFVEHVFEGFVFVHVSKNVLISLQNCVRSECILVPFLAGVNQYLPLGCLTSMMVGMS